MSGTAPGFAELKKGMKAAWMAGDFGQIARHSERRGEEFVARLGLRPGMKVLDVACGTGNQSIPAARTGAKVTAVDIATNSLEQARKRADAEGLKIRFIEGDAEDLPAETAQFDVVCSMFGAMFAPRPELVASEMIRVCKPGGLIAMANWTPGGFVGQMFKINGSHLPPQPGVPAPTLWGEEAVVRQRFGPKVKDRGGEAGFSERISVRARRGCEVFPAIFRTDARRLSRNWMPPARNPCGTI